MPIGAPELIAVKLTGIHPAPFTAGDNACVVETVAVVSGWNIRIQSPVLEAFGVALET